MRIFCTKVFLQSSKQLKQLLQKLKHDQHGMTYMSEKKGSEESYQQKGFVIRKLLKERTNRSL